MYKKSQKAGPLFHRWLATADSSFFHWRSSIRSFRRHDGQVPVVDIQAVSSEETTQYETQSRRSLFSKMETRRFSSWTESSQESRPSWSKEWEALGLGARLVNDGQLTNLMFVQLGFGVDQHGNQDATKASVRAVRNAIEFNSIPGVIEAIPGGRKEMMIQVKLGVPSFDGGDPLPVNVLEVAKVFPYGKLMPLEIVIGGLSFPTGRVVEELGDTDDTAICVAASVSLGYDNGSSQQKSHTTYSTRDGC